MLKQKYIGWVPCLSGKLYFKHISCGLGEEVIVSVNHKEILLEGENNPDERTGQMPYKRHVVLCSHVNWKDTRKENGDFHVVMIGNATHVSDLTGRVYIIHRDSINMQWDGIISEIKLLNKNVLRAYRKDEDIIISERYSNIKKCLDDFRSDYFYTVEYKVDRHGFAYLDYVGEIDDQEHMLTVVRQAFYYIKYSIHKHQHHKDADDSLTTAHLAPENIEDIGEQLIDDLKESMVAMKRDLVPTRDRRLYDVKGVVSYAKSLLQSCLYMKYISKDNYDHECQYVDNMKSSIETIVQNTERKITLNISSSNSARSFILLLFAVIAPYVIINSSRISKGLTQGEGDGTLPSGINFLFSKFAGTTTGFLTVLGILVAIYLCSKAIDNRFGSIMLFLKGSGKFFSEIANDIYKGYVLLTVTVIVFMACMAGVLYYLLMM